MPDYKESNVFSKQWDRFSRVILDNPSGGQPSMHIAQETAVQLADQVVTKHARFINVAFDPDSGIIELYNPATGMKTGATMTHAEFYAAVYSACMTAAVAMDEASA